MPKVIGSATGNNLKITIPERGEKNWDQLIENSCFTPISNHSHTGNGDGAKIDTDALEDGAVTTDKIDGLQVTNAKLGFESVSTDKIETYAVTTAKIADANVTNAKLDSAIQGKLTQVDSNTTSITNLQNDVTNNSNTISTHTNDITMIQQWNLANLNDVASTTPSTGQVLKWDGASWGPGTDASSAGSGVITISSQGDANAYSNSVGDIIVISGHSQAIDFPNSISQSKIYITGSYNVTFSGAVIGCVINCEGGGLVSFEDSAFRCDITHGGGTIVLGPFSSGTKYFKENRVLSDSLLFETSGNGSVSVNSSLINVLTIDSYGGTHQDNKIHINDGTVIECEQVLFGSSDPDITVSRHSTIRVLDLFYGKIYNYNRSAYILNRAITDAIEVPFEIVDNVFTTKVPVAGRYNISSSVTVDTSELDTLDVQWDTVEQQTGGLSLSNGKIKIPYDGWYQMTAGVYVHNLDNTSDTAGIRWRITVNGNSQVYNHETQVTGNLTMVQDSGSTLFYCEKDDLIGVYVQEISDADNSIILNGVSTATFLAIQMVK